MQMGLIGRPPLLLTVHRPGHPHCVSPTVVEILYCNCLTNFALVLSGKKYWCLEILRDQNMTSTRLQPVERRIDRNDEGKPRTGCRGTPHLQKDLVDGAALGDLESSFFGWIRRQTDFNIESRVILIQQSGLSLGPEVFCITAGHTVDNQDFQILLLVHHVSGALSSSSDRRSLIGYPISPRAVVP